MSRLRFLSDLQDRWGIDSLEAVDSTHGNAIAFIVGTIVLGVLDEGVHRRRQVVRGAQSEFVEAVIAVIGTRLGDVVTTASLIITSRVGDSSHFFVGVDALIGTVDVAEAVAVASTQGIAHDVAAFAVIIDIGVFDLGGNTQRIHGVLSVHTISFGFDVIAARCCAFQVIVIEGVVNARDREGASGVLHTTEETGVGALVFIARSVEFTFSVALVLCANSELQAAQ